MNQQQQTNNLPTGHVFPMQADGVFGVLTYSPETVVVLAMFSNEETVMQACAMLNSRFAGRFIPADSDATAWGKVTFAAQGSAVLM